MAFTPTARPQMTRRFFAIALLLCAVFLTRACRRPARVAMPEAPPVVPVAPPAPPPVLTETVAPPLAPVARGLAERPAAVHISWQPWATTSSFPTSKTVGGRGAFIDPSLTRLLPASFARHSRPLRTLRSARSAADFSRVVSGGGNTDSCGGRKSDSRQHGLAAG